MRVNCHFGTFRQSYMIGTVRTLEGSLSIISLASNHGFNMFHFIITNGNEHIIEVINFRTTLLWRTTRLEFIKQIEVAAAVIINSDLRCWLRFEFIPMLLEKGVIGMVGMFFYQLHEAISRAW